MIKVKDLEFEISITSEDIEHRIESLAERINFDYEGKCPIIIAILNGSFIFAADITRHFNFDHEIHFAKYSSYQGTQSTGNVKSLLGMPADISDRDIIIIEDIVDSGVTMSAILSELESKGPRSVEICTLLMKPENLKVDINVKYCAFEIPNLFVVGYGLDYDGLGRNYPDIYTVCDN